MLEFSVWPELFQNNQQCRQWNISWHSSWPGRSNWSHGYSQVNIAPSTHRVVNRSGSFFKLIIKRPIFQNCSVKVCFYQTLQYFCPKSKKRKKRTNKNYLFNTFVNVRFWFRFFKMIYFMSIWRSVSKGLE